MEITDELLKAKHAEFNARIENLLKELRSKPNINTLARVREAVKRSLPVKKVASGTKQ